MTTATRPRPMQARDLKGGDRLESGTTVYDTHSGGYARTTVRVLRGDGMVVHLGTFTDNTVFWIVN